jgi:hypothetical protein
VYRCGKKKKVENKKIDCIVPLFGSRYRVRKKKYNSMALRDRAVTDILDIAVEIRKATYGDASVRIDVRQTLNTAIRKIFVQKRIFEFDTGDHAPSKLFGDPFPGSPKFLELDISYVIDDVLWAMQKLKINERACSWVDDGSNIIPHPYYSQHMIKSSRCRLQDDTMSFTPNVVSIESAEAAVGCEKGDVVTSGASALVQVASADLDIKDEKRAVTRAIEPLVTKVQPTEFGSMSKLYVVYHICTIGEWETIVSEQIASLVQSGLYENVIQVFISIVGPHALRWQPPESICRKTTVCYRSSNTKEFERTAIRIIQREIPCGPDVFCLYLHTKGVSRPKGDWILTWRKFMEYFVIDNYQTCIRVLRAGYDTCGVNWLPFSASWPPLRFLIFEHYSGNFWWARGDYLAKLRNVVPSSHYIAPELWIGFAYPNAWSLHNSSNPSLGIPYVPTEYESRFTLPSLLLSSSSPSSSSSSSSSSPNEFRTT